MKKIFMILTVVAFLLMVAMPVVASNYTAGNATISAESREITPMAQYAWVNANNVRLRSAPGLSSSTIMYLHQGYEVVLRTDLDRVYKDGYWWEPVRYNGPPFYGVNGWVATIYLDYGA